MSVVNAKTLILLFPIAILVGLGNAFAYDPNDVTSELSKKPAALEGVSIKENLGDQLDMSLSFTDDKGEAVTLSKYFDNTRPVVMTVIYYGCPGLCNHHLNGLTATMKQLNWTAGHDYRLVAVSMNHREGTDLAAAKKANYLKSYGKPDGADGWHFLTGTEENVKKVTDQLGFGFKWLPDKEEYSHASAAFIMTPGGQISRYLHGISFLPKTLKLALLEASDGKIGSVVEQVLMYCFQFDPKKNKYTIYAWNVMRIAGTFTVLGLSILLIPVWIRERKKKKA